MTELTEAQSQVEALLERYPSDYYPMYTVGGRFGEDRKRWTHWCDGFYPGMMFIFAEATGRNPGAADQIRNNAIIFAALAEGVVFFAIFLAK